MKKDKPQYLSYKDVSKIVKSNKLHYLILIGQRSNGKSYACKELCLRAAYEKGEQFTYLRRYKDQIKVFKIREYFDDFVIPKVNGKNKIEQITRGKFNNIEFQTEKIKLIYRDPESGKVTDSMDVGNYHALKDLESLKSRQFPSTKYTIFEEFISTGLYLYPNEPDTLQQYVSTVLRNNNGTIFMIGNTISRIVPYFTQWSLDNVPKQKQGTVDIYTYHDDNDVESRIGVFLCESLNYNSGMFFGSSAKMIVSGLWDRSEQPRLEHPVDQYDTVYDLVFQFSEKALFYLRLLELRENPDIITWYVEPKTTPIKPGTRVVSPIYTANPLYTQTFKPLNQREAVAFAILENQIVAFSDNLTGTEYQRCIEQLKKKHVIK